MTRYKQVFEHTSYPHLVVAREVLQNSVDAGATDFNVTSRDFPTVVLPPSLRAQPFFVLWQDNGLWSTGDKQGRSSSSSSSSTYDRCVNYFLCMNGSTKPQHSEAQTGGFGVGRFVILFNAPLWVMTTRHMLIVGHYHYYQILCRSCQAPLAGDMCSHCRLAETDTPRGTSMLVNYSWTTSSDALGTYLTNMRQAYFRYCNPKITLRMHGQSMSHIPNRKLVARHARHKLKAYHIGASSSAYHLVRTANGILMYSHMAADSSVSGVYVVELPSSVTYMDFDQARQTLHGKVGTQVTQFLTRLQDNLNHHDVEAIHEQHFPGFMQVTQQFTPLRKVLADVQPVTTVTANCLYHNGYTADTVPDIWNLSDPTYEATFVLVAWAYTLGEVVRRLQLTSEHGVQPWSIGYIFDDGVRATLKDRTFYINPMELTRTLDIKFLAAGTPRKLRKPLWGWLIACALHEVSHLRSKLHDVKFAAFVTHITASTLTYSSFASGVMACDAKAGRTTKSVMQGYRKRVSTAHDAKVELKKKVKR